MPAATCPECESMVHVDAAAEQGTLIKCDDCDSDLELVGLDPVELDPYRESDPESYEDMYSVFERD